MYLQIIYLSLGIILLMMGRKLFWLFAGGIGFILGCEYTTLLLKDASDQVVLIAALVIGMIAIILTFLMQKIGIGIAGFMAGGYVAVSIINELGVKLGWIPWLVFLLGGIIGALLSAFLFDWALIILSCLTGAFLIISTMNFSLQLTQILFLILVIIGIAAQVTQNK
ncbi:MAG: DUF4203 domain-containing protein [Candidatus Omnitrophota bacterium]